MFVVHLMLKRILWFNSSCIVSTCSVSAHTGALGFPELVHNSAQLNQSPWRDKHKLDVSTRIRQLTMFGQLGPVVILIAVTSSFRHTVARWTTELNDNFLHFLAWVVRLLYLEKILTDPWIWTWGNCKNASGLYFSGCWTAALVCQHVPELLPFEILDQ